MLDIRDPRLKEFYRGLMQAQEFITRLNPDMLVVPLRGAKPLHVLVRRLAQADGKLDEMPPHVELPIGEVLSSEPDNAHMGVKAATSERKKELVREQLVPELESLGRSNLLCALSMR